MRMLACSLSTCLREIHFHGQNLTRGILVAISIAYGTGLWRTRLGIWKDRMSFGLKDDLDLE